MAIYGWFSHSIYSYLIRNVFGNAHHFPEIAGVISIL